MSNSIQIKCSEEAEDLCEELLNVVRRYGDVEVESGIVKVWLSLYEFVSFTQPLHEAQTHSRKDPEA